MRLSRKLKPPCLTNLSFNVFFIQVRENLEINTEKQILEEEDINKDQTSILVETMEEKLKEENTGATMSIKEVNRLFDSLI